MLLILKVVPHSSYAGQIITNHAKAKEMHSVGFEPTSANTLELESSSLDRSDTNAWMNE